jgi:hypothetical protein
VNFKYKERTKVVKVKRFLLPIIVGVQCRHLSRLEIILMLVAES